MFELKIPCYFIKSCNNGIIRNQNKRASKNNVRICRKKKTTRIHLSDVRGPVSDRQSAFIFKDSGLVLLRKTWNSYIFGRHTRKCMVTFEIHGDRHWQSQWLRLSENENYTGSFPRILRSAQTQTQHPFWIPFIQNYQARSRLTSSIYNQHLKFCLICVINRFSK